jgi:holliday junction DNA helicase RuvB
MSDINDIRPTSISHIIGQKHVREVVALGLDYAHQENKKFDHAMLVGPPGLGKTNFATIISMEMATDFTELLGQSFGSVADLNQVLLSATPRSIVFIDEVHEMSKSLQTTLYLALDQRKILIPGGKNGSAPMSIPIQDFTLLLATTDEYLLLQPLRDRMKLTLRFSFYSADELTQIVASRSRGLDWNVDEEVFPAIANKGRGTPRLALRLLESAHRVCRAEGEHVITISHLTRACGLEQIDSMGLGPTEQKYLDCVTDGPTRLNVIASMLGLPKRTVSEVTEPYLMRAGLIVKDDQGRRQLTQMGREHLSNCSQIRVGVSSNE